MNEPAEEKQKLWPKVPRDPPGTRWRSCCFHIDSRFCRFTVCMLVSILTLNAALYKLVTDGSCDTYGFWGPILSLIIGIWTPTPKKNTK